ncbi:30S ribosomal protein S11 [Candidatus Vidania fulgoroideorum]
MKYYIYILSTSNNNIITFAKNHKVVFCKSSGNLNFKGSRKSTPYAAQKLAEFVCDKIKGEKKIKKINIQIKGFGMGREAILRVFASLKDIEISSIADKTPYKHNGCRPKKKRRI